MATIIPSIDILGGTTVQLVGGDEEKKKVECSISLLTYRLTEGLPFPLPSNFVSQVRCTRACAIYRVRRNSSG
jgi:hypothetical protein